MKVLWQTKNSRKKINRRVQQEKSRAKVDVRHMDINPRLLILAGVFLLMIISSYVLWLKLMDPQTLPLRQVKLEASFSKVSKQALHEVVSANINGGFFSLDVDAVTAAVTELPWVDAASVQRVWPDTLHVTIIEQVAMARWRDQALVNERGELFFPTVESFSSDLIELHGPDNSVAQMAQHFSVFNRALEKSGYRMKRIALSQRRAWELELDSGVVVVLGRHDMESRLKRFVQFYPQLLARVESVKRIDMRYTNGFAVQWRV